MAHDLQIEDVVRFFGYIPEEVLEGALADATAVVMPSLAGEVFGMVAAQNMQRGRAVIVSDIGALAEVMGSAGMKFAPGDGAGLAYCMESVITNPSLGETLGRKASERIAQFFSADQMVRDHLRVYEKVCRS